MRLSTALLVTVLFWVPGYAQSDTQPAQLVGLTFSPSNVDVTSSPQTVTFMLHLTDNLSGLADVSVSLRSPSGLQNPSGVVFPPVGTVDAILAVPVEIQRYSEPGTWTVASVFLTDRAGNVSILATAALSAAGFPTAFTVADANPDLVAPQLTAITMSPNPVDVSSTAATITVDASFTDALSGFSTGNQLTLFDFWIASPSGNQSRFVSILQWVLVSGTANNGIWRASFNMPRYSEPGLWQIAQLRTRDATGNTHLYLGGELDTLLGASRNLSVTSSPADVTPPILTGLTLTPSFINTSLGPQTVQVGFSMTDDLAGVGFWPDTPHISLAAGASFRSPSGAQFVRTIATFSNAPPIVGTPLNGVWQFNVTFRQFSEEGTWQVSVSLRDFVRNLLNLSTQQLDGLGIAHTINVIRPSLQPDGTISDPSTGGTVSDTVFGDRATLIIPGGVLSTPTTAAIDVLSSPLNVPLPNGFSSLETYFVNVELTPTPSFPLPPPGITAVLPLRNYTIPGTGINLFRVDPTSGDLVPALDTSGNPLVGHVDSGGLTATFARIARFSTIVGILPDAIPVQIAIKPGETPNSVNLRSKGTVPVAVFSTPTLDMTQIDPSTLRFAGAPVAGNKNGNLQVAYADMNGDGLDDVIAHFEIARLLLSTADTQAVVEGRTRDDRLFRGVDSVSPFVPK
jgi:hypothetical protein